MTEGKEELQTSGIPDYEDNWEKIKDQLPKFNSPMGWEDVFDSITVTWRDYSRETSDRARALAEAIALPNIPQLEVTDALEYLTNTRKDWDKFVEGIRKIATGVKLEWSEMRELSGIAKNIKNANSDQDVQATAMLQAISETHKEGRSPKWVRQRIAQHAFEEIVNIGVYRAIDYSGDDDWVTDRSTQDGPRDERAELLHALNHELWDKKTLESKTKDYKHLRKIILKGDNSVDEETADPLEDLWKAANGKGITRKSALYYLQLAEDVYKELEEGGAFDVELLEEDGDGD